MRTSEFVVMSSTCLCVSLSLSLPLILCTQLQVLSKCIEYIRQQADSMKLVQLAVVFPLRSPFTLAGLRGLEVDTTQHLLLLIQGTGHLVVDFSRCIWDEGLQQEMETEDGVLETDDDHDLGHVAVAQVVSDNTREMRVLPISDEEEEKGPAGSGRQNRKDGEEPHDEEPRPYTYTRALAELGHGSATKTNELVGVATHLDNVVQ